MDKTQPQENKARVQNMTHIYILSSSSTNFKPKGTRAAISDMLYKKNYLGELKM